MTFGIRQQTKGHEIKIDFSDEVGERAFIAVNPPDHLYGHVCFDYDFDKDEGLIDIFHQIQEGKYDEYRALVFSRSNFDTLRGFTFNPHSIPPTKDESLDRVKELIGEALEIVNKLEQA